MAIYWVFAYDLDRKDFIRLFLLYSGAFLVTYHLIQWKRDDFRFLAVVGLVYRLVFLFSIPGLSQDFFRFIWDGLLVLKGISPYGSTPEQLMDSPDMLFPAAEALYQGMGNLSAGHYSNYPPVNQFIFAAGSLAEKEIPLGPVLVMRLLIILADLGILFLGKKLLQILKLPIHRIFWYFLNPFIIIELTGNLHFEGIMGLFLLGALYLLYKGQWVLGAILTGISISVKLLPLMLLPFFLRYFRARWPEGGFAKLTGFYLLSGVSFLLSFLPFLSPELLNNFFSSIGLWFGKFEFNASFYYLVRWIGYQVKGYNIIETAGRILPLISLLLIILLSLFRKNYNLERLFSSMLMGLTVYFLFSTTIHPWYLTIPLLLGIFTPYRFTLLWSYLIFLSYQAYGHPLYQENPWLIAGEYLPVIALLLWEIYKKELLPWLKGNPGRFSRSIQK